MAVVAVSDDNHRWDDMDANTNCASIGGGTGALDEPDMGYQKTSGTDWSVSRKSGSTSDFGFYTTTGGARDHTVIGQKVWMAKIMLVNHKALNSTGLKLRIGSDGTNYYWYQIATDTLLYPAKSSWLIIPVDPNVSGYANGAIGTPVLSAVDYYAVTTAMASTSKGQNLVMDAVDAGTGLYLVGGDLADTDGDFDDFITDDEGDVINGAFGYVYTQEGIIFVTGTLYFGQTSAGSTTATGFTDSGQIIVFPDGRVAAGFFALDFDLGNANTDISLDDCVFISQGNETITDTRAQLNVTGTSGALNITGCSLDNFSDFTLTSGVTLTDCKIANSEGIAQASATITGCEFTGATTGDGEAFIASDDPELISNCSFTFSDGHAIEITATGVYDFVGNTFSGYGADASNDACIYNNSGGSVTLNVSGGDVPTIRNGSGASTTINNNVSLDVHVEDEGGGNILNAQVAIYKMADDSEITNEDTDASGNSQTDYNYGGTPVQIYVRVRKSSTGLTRYYPFKTTGTINENGFSLDVILIQDNIVAA